LKNKDLVKVLEYIEHLPDEKERDETKAIFLQSAADSTELKRLKLKTKGKIVDEELGEKKYLKFTKEEINEMPDYLKRLFIVDEKIIPYRIVKGSYYQARYRRDGISVSATFKSFDLMKRVLIDRIKKAEQEKQNSMYPRLEEFIDDWLRVKKQTIKESTYESYILLLNRHVLPNFGKMRLNEINRKNVQDYLFNLTEAGKNRTAQKLKQLLSNMFQLIEEDYDLKNPMRKVVLAPYVVKKGVALSIDEEKQIIDFCSKNTHYLGNSAILLLLYTGMRFGELASIEVFEDHITCISEKTRKGYAEVVREIPFSPMLKRVLHLIDFEKAKSVSNDVARDALKRVFPKRHVHEFRYTFITRAKECGINPEVVMLWTGHESDRDVKTSRVDRGYTTYSQEYVYKEMEKYDYEL